MSNTQDKHAGGRPLLFKDKKSLQLAIDDYFNSCFEKVEIEDRSGNIKIKNVQIKPFTIAGLAYALGTNRQTLLNYEKKEQFFDTIKKAKCRVEANVEESLFQGKPVGAIFNLKNNFGWKDKNEIDHTSNGETIDSHTTIIFKDFSEEDETDNS